MEIAFVGFVNFFIFYVEYVVKIFMTGHDFMTNQLVHKIFNKLGDGQIYWSVAALDIDTVDK